MDNTIVIDGHVFRLETRLSDSPWQDTGSRGSCYNQPDMSVAPVIDFHPYPAMGPEAPNDPPPAQTLDMRPYPAVEPGEPDNPPATPTLDMCSHSTVEPEAPNDPPTAPVLDICQYSTVAQEPPNDMADTAPNAGGASPKQNGRTHPSPTTTKKSDRQRTETPQLDGKLRFESSRLYLSDGDSAGRPVYSVSGDHLAPAGNLNISKLQPFYDVAMEEITHMDGAPGAGHVYSVELARLLNLMEVAEGELLLDKGEAIEHVLDAIDYGSGFAAPTSAPWKNCLRLLGRAGYDWEKDIVLFTAPLLSRLAATGLKSAEAADAPAGDVRVIEAEADNAKGITRTKLRRLGLLDQFRFIQEDDEGSILFALPLPPPYEDGLEYDLLEDGVQMTKKDFHHAEDAWQRYADSLPVCSKRTKGNAMDTTPLPDAIAIITDKKYHHALIPIQDDTAFIMPASVADSLRIGNGMIDLRNFTFSLEECGPEDIAKLDFTLLATVYSIILKKMLDKINKAQNPEMILQILEDADFEYAVQLHIPEFLEKIGSKPDADENRFCIVKEKLKSFDKVVGIHIIENSRGTQFERYDVMQWLSDSNKTNMVRFQSPYCNQIIRILLKKHLKRDKYGNIQMTPGGQPQLSPFNSFAIQLILNTERNKLAAEIVRYVVYLVDASGRSNGTPHAKARTILNECPELKHRIATAKSNSDRNKYLKRAFTRAWQILNDPKCLDLLKQHKDFQVPTDIPTMKTLDSLVFRFSSKDAEPSAPKKRR